MSTLSPAHSAHSFLSPKSNGYISADQVQRTPIVSTPISGTYAKALASAKLANDALSLSPDELFTKYTVSEVKAVQQRLKADADAKQEELRLMVGERYRDLLQASSSIIAIAKSSQRVLDSLEESREAILSQHDLPLPPKTAAIDGLDDRHLYALQVLSAHMKLLLDAPEHLWRLIERKKYFQAAWLFLLSRVVHRALVRHDENDEQSWVNEGVDVLAEFPLVQRQWEVVSQFRSQIIHKSTLSLREASASTEDTCATLVTLHLLDSRPLNETLAALLLQRSKTLHSILSWKPDSGSSKQSSTPSIANGHPPGSVKPVPVRELTQIMKKALSTIAQTVSSARTIFQDQTSEPSLIISVLQSIQEDQTESESPSKRLPDELHLTTQSLLTQLTSSANFQLLPPNLRLYKPYIDLNSSSASLSHSTLSQRLQEWFNASSDQWQHSASKWFSGLYSMKEVWTLRNSIRRYITSSGLDSTEKNYILSNLDSVCHERITGVWQKTLSDTETKFKKSLREKSSSQQSEVLKVYPFTLVMHTSPVDFLFQPPPIPTVSQTVKSFVDTPFQKYQISLKRQLVGRSSQLDTVLSTLEQCARAIQQDFLHLRANGDDKTKTLIERLTQTYQPAATALSIRIVSILDDASVDTIRDAGFSYKRFVFLSRITDDLASSSLFIKNIGCTPESSQDFKQKVTSINDKITEKWREIIVQRVIHERRAILTNRTAGPTPEILQALLSLCDSIRQLGVIYHPVRQHVIVQQVLRSFITSWTKEFFGGKGGENTVQDIVFLRHISDQYGESWNEISAVLSEKLKSFVRLLNKLHFGPFSSFFFRFLTRAHSPGLTVLRRNILHGCKPCSQFSFLHP
ncbi:hypothetical protein BDZ97DRAFT_1648009 [Flammula alnicola]|nr:hypothetical protein BDZ97DRAFT_1648009 [Flammula alnicola]